MEIRYEDGKQIITHPSRLVTEYSEDDILQMQAGCDDMISIFAAAKIGLEIALQEIRNSRGT